MKAFIKSKATVHKKKPQVVNGQNIRFSSEGHRRLADFCKKKGWKLAAYCEQAAIERLENDLPFVQSM